MVKRLFPAPEMVATEPGNEPHQSFRLTLPAHRAAQLRELAESREAIAIHLVEAWVLEKLDEQDPLGELIPVSPPADVDGGPIATVTRLPFLSRQFTDDLS